MNTKMSKRVLSFHETIDAKEVVGRALNSLHFFSLSDKFMPDEKRTKYLVTVKLAELNDKSELIDN